MRVIRKEQIFEINDDEMTSLYLGVEKIVHRNHQTGFVKRLDFTKDEEQVFEIIHKSLCPFFGDDPNQTKKDVNISSHSKTTESFR